jgi:hypothetical protein
MTSLSRIKAMVALGVFAVAMAGCAGAATGSLPVPTTPPPAPVTTAEDALSRVVTTEPRLTGIKAFDTGLVGQSSWYTVEPASGVGSFIVTVHVGWGDCQAGCIDEHGWTYAVTPDGAVVVESESGPAVPADAWPSPIGAGRTGIGGTALAGPVCPVERNPPDPNCAARPVAGATIEIRDSGGSLIAQTVTAADGSFFVEVAPGEYQVMPQPAEGLLGTAGRQTVTVADGAATLVELDYDTGIR